jgi:hypothetical protein
MSCVKSQSVVLAFDETPAEDSRTMEFRLIYSGRVLGASRNDTRASLKMESLIEQAKANPTVQEIVRQQVAPLRDRIRAEVGHCDHFLKL